MLSLTAQNLNIFAEIFTACFYLRRGALLLGVSSAASTAETALKNTERITVLASPVELWNIPLPRMAVGNSSCFCWRKLFNGPPTLNSRTSNGGR
jgi:hypothetical protein